MEDLTLVKMCDTPEIQDRWEPKVGDRIWSKLHKCYATVTEMEGNGIMHLMADDGNPIWRVMRDEVVYINCGDEIQDKGVRNRMNNGNGGEG